MPGKALLRLVLYSGIVLLFTGCANVKLEPGAESVDVFYSFAGKEGCEYMGDVIGNDGNLMTYLFMTNPSLTRGALNDIRNKAGAMGGDTVYIIREQLRYVTSTTLLGTVYKCDE